ncbi:PREDICTED: uncharacterized protein At1g65710-like [Nicotiana attenuata]|uniref:Uncharacterized protein n=1 Tax=Nicotiana attenuata TaxID=49451 RepID=A0A1J6J6T0_NICAT|nr:PREDICTED: uncharacterized protein At1g65710-like [Nicotiana attenuata]OIT06587.1 uncharacterized protein A4A49_13804 [Nicotiana attenuata]
MGSCLSKKCSSTCTPVAISSTNQETKPNTLQVEKKKVEGQIVRKEIFVIKHRISHEGSICSKGSKDNANNSNGESSKKNATIIVPARVRSRSSSCTKEEVDAILVQCGRLSRSSSINKGLSLESCDNTKNHNRSRRYSISKKSYDFDNENTSGGSRRVSRSPGRRSESPITANNCAELVSTASIQRIQVKRNVGAASPRARSRSPARVSAKVSNENMNFLHQPLSLSRNNSRKREDSPFSRNPLSEIGSTTVVTEHMPFHALKPVNNNFHPQKLNAEHVSYGKVVQQETEKILGISKATLDYGLTNVNGKVKEQQQLAQEAKALRTVTANAAVDVVGLGFESLVPQGMRRSRSSRLSRDLDISLGDQSKPTQSYTELLLEDIQNFHQKSSKPAFSLPPCVTKACSIVEAVADLNSSTSSSLSSAFSDDRRRNPKVEQLNKNTDTSLGTTPQGKKRLQIKEPYVESEVAPSDDLIKSPIIQKYVTFGRGTDGGYFEEPESSGSNSSVGGQRCWFSPSSRGPNSADSTDSWSPSKSYSRLHVNPLAFQTHSVSECGRDMDEDKRRMTANTRDSDNQQRGIGRNRTPRGPHTISMAAAAASTY